jgi:hypothetical protein
MLVDNVCDADTAKGARGADKILKMLRTTFEEMILGDQAPQIG